MTAPASEEIAVKPPSAGRLIGKGRLETGVDGPRGLSLSRVVVSRGEEGRGCSLGASAAAGRTKCLSSSESVGNDLSDEARQGWWASQKPIREPRPV